MMDQWLKRTGKQQGGKHSSNWRTNATQKETKTLGPNSHIMLPSRQKMIKKKAACAGRFYPYNNAEDLRRKEQLKEQ